LLRLVRLALIILLMAFFGFLAVSVYTLQFWRSAPSRFRRSPGFPYYTRGVVYHPPNGNHRPVAALAKAARAAGCDFILVVVRDGEVAETTRGNGYYNGVLVLWGREVPVAGGAAVTWNSPSSSGPGELSLWTVPWLSGRFQPLPGDCSAVEIMRVGGEWWDDGLFNLLRAVAFLRAFPRSSRNSLVKVPEFDRRVLDDPRRRPPPAVLASVGGEIRLEFYGHRLACLVPLEELFRLMRTYVVTRSPLVGDYPGDAELVLRALGEGRCYSAWSGLGDARGFRFQVRSGTSVVEMGGRLVADEFPVEVSAGLKSGEKVLIRLYRNGEPVASSHSGSLAVKVGRSGVYRVEVYRSRRDILGLFYSRKLWLFSGPITILSTPDRAGGSRREK